MLSEKQFMVACFSEDSIAAASRRSEGITDFFLLLYKLQNGKTTEQSPIFSTPQLPVWQVPYRKHFVYSGF